MFQISWLLFKTFLPSFDKTAEKLSVGNMLVDLCVKGQIVGRSRAKVSEVVSDLQYLVVDAG